MKSPPPFSRAMSYGLYEGSLAEAINQLKFGGIRRLSRYLGDLLLSMDLPEMDAIVPVPLNVKKLRKRGFNQSLLIARRIAKKKEIALLMDVLSKKKETQPQTDLPAKERLVNLKGAFEIRGNVRGLKLFLVDDVMTTGTTVRECSMQLMRAGAKEVVVLILARAGLM
ncbi:MAG: ComF family protein [Nitrospirota bacterium]